MRTTALIAVALLSLPAHAAQVSPFNQPCVENESIIASVQPQIAPVRPTLAEIKPGAMGPGCHRGQLSREDLSYMESVRPSDIAPVVEPVIYGLYAHRGQLGPEDISQIESVQPSKTAPLMETIITGLLAHRAQLGQDDLSQIESVQPAGAVIYGRARN